MMKRSNLLKYSVILSVPVLIISAMWFFGVFGDIAKPMAQTSSSANSCEVIYRDSCGRDPIAVNERFSFLYGQNKEGLCDISIDPDDRINKRATVSEGKCAIEKSLDDRCEEEVLDTFNSSSLENIRIDGPGDQQKLTELGPCGQAYQRLHTQ